MKNVTTKILWAVYICLLLVLLPHTAWAFQNWEPTGAKTSMFTSYVAAFAFEAAIAALTHKLSKHIEDTPRSKTGWKRFMWRYVNPLAFGLGIATVVSALANLAHAVEFGRSLKIFAEWGISPGFYSLAFGGVLPLVSLIFARVLSNVIDDEEAPNPEVEQAKVTVADLRKQLRESEQRVKVVEDNLRRQLAESEATAKATEEDIRKLLADAEDRARIAEERFGAAGDLMRRIFGDDKRERIIAVHQWRPQLTGQAIAMITESSPAYVSEVLKEADVIDA